jgi:hypothetical protein
MLRFLIMCFDKVEKWHRFEEEAREICRREVD